MIFDCLIEIIDVIKIAVCFSQNEEASFFLGGATLQNVEPIVCLLEELRYYSRKLQTFLSTRTF